jgi:hypothetical protein
MNVRTLASILCATLLAACGMQQGPVRFDELVVGDGRLPVELELPHGLALSQAMVLPDEGIPVRLRFTGTPGARYRCAVYHLNTTYAFPLVDEAGRAHPFATENFMGADTLPFTTVRADEAGRVEHTMLVRLRSDPRHEFPQMPAARDPRTGSYALLAVAVPGDAFAEGNVPEAISDLRIRRHGTFADPFHYWLHGDGARLPGVRVQRVDDAIRLHARPDPARGVLNCGTAMADLQAFIHHIDPASRFDNIPVIADVAGNGFTPRQHDSAWCFTPRDAWVPTLPSVSADPCSTVRYDTAAHALELRNPAASAGRMIKQNTGAGTVRPFTYGRFVVHARLPALLNDSDLWNGLTNAVWLIGSDSLTGQRRACTGGYRVYSMGSTDGQRRERTAYSEIDFEIMKGMPLCPERSFPPIYPQPVADPSDPTRWRRSLPAEVLAQRGRVAVACTNWDLACPDPPDFAIGCHDVAYEGRQFPAHRWDRDYRALTQKSMEPDSSLFGPQGCWFVIDWRPTEIIWRIGPDLEHLRVVGYMNDRVTAVPNAPMSLVVTQEFHNTAWWPGSPYEQGGIPFPAKDLVGRVFSLRVE